jgi:hypothetical protein
VNLLPSAGFDSDVSGWSGNTLLSWAPDDAVQCPISGSLHAKSTASSGSLLSRCFNIPAGPTSYNAGAKVRALPGSAAGAVWLEVYFQTGADCGGNTTFFADGSPTRVVPSSDWSTFTAPTVSGVTGIASVFYELHFLRTEQVSASLDVEIDMAYLAPSPGVGWK